MELTKKVPTTDKAGRELPLEDAFRKITELRDARRNARI